MNRLEFTASVIGSIVWPSTVIVVLFVFRTQLRNLIARVRSGKLTRGEWTLMAEFNQQARELDAQMKSALPASIAQPITVDLHTVADSDPHQAVMLGWRAVSNQVTATAEALQLDDNGGGLSGNVRVMEELARRGLVTGRMPAFGQSLLELMVAANSDPDSVTQASAHTYLESVARVVAELRAAAA